MDIFENIETIKICVSEYGGTVRIYVSEFAGEIEKARLQAVRAEEAAQNAELSTANAQTWAEGEEADVVALGGEKSSKDWALHAHAAFANALLGTFIVFRRSETKPIRPGNSTYHIAQGWNSTIEIAGINAELVGQHINKATVAIEPGYTLFGLATIEGRPLGDVNNSGAVNATDALAYQQNQVGNINNLYINTIMNPYMAANRSLYDAYFGGILPLWACIGRLSGSEWVWDEPFYIAEGSIPISFGPKYSALDAGVQGQTFIDDDFLYVCVQTGEAGFARWKRTPLKLI